MFGWLMNSPVRSGAYVRRNLCEVFSWQWIDLYQITDFARAENIENVMSTSRAWRRYTCDPINSGRPSLDIPTSVFDGLNRPGNSIYFLAAADHIASYIGVQVKSKRITAALRFGLEDHECFIGPYHTEPQYRGRGLIGEGIRCILSDIRRDTEINTVYVDIGSKNHASIRVIEKLGGERLPTGYCVVRFWRNDYFCSARGWSKTRIRVHGE